jgi:hypothetical protein
VNRVRRLPRNQQEKNHTITNVQQNQEVDVGIHSKVAKALQIATLQARSVPNSYKVVPLSNNHCDNIDTTQYTEQTKTIGKDCAADLCIDLQNSCSLLNGENSKVLGEAFSEDAHLEVVEIVSNSRDEALIFVEEMPSKAVDPVTSLHWANTPVLTPLDLPSSSVPSHLRLDKSLHQFPVEPGDCAHITSFDASVKVTPDNNTSHPSMPHLVTTSYDSLTSDKLPSNQNLVLASKPHSVAALKSVQILSKFWGDEVVEEDNDETNTSIFEQHYPSLSERTKAERKQKKQVNKVKPISFNLAGMRTRAQKGT